MGNSNRIDAKVELGNVVGSVLQIGVGNQAQVDYKQVTLAEPSTIDVAAVLRSLKEELVKLETPDAPKILGAVADAEHELGKPEPDREEVGAALARALKYAERAKDFAAAVGTVAPLVRDTVAWLGSNWHHLLKVVGLTA